MSLHKHMEMIKKMSEKIMEADTSSTGKATKFNKILLIFVCAFVSLAIIFGGVLGIIMGVKNARAAVRYNGLTMEPEVASFFASYYKSYYMSLLASSGNENVSDTLYFWNSESEEGATYGELLSKNTDLYIKQIMVAVYLFDSYNTLTDAEKETINSVVNDILIYKANGSIEAFNSATERYGFSYDSFIDAATMMYKSVAVKSALYGHDGSNIAVLPELCEEYLKEYSHVKMLFIRTEDEFLLDEEGNRVSGEEGDVMRPLTEKEREEREAAIADIREYIAAAENGGDIQMSPELFDSYLKKYDNADNLRHTSGYYLHSSSKYTSGFASAISVNVVKAALAAEVNSYTEVEWEHGVCFIYKYEPATSAYASSAIDIYFEDFYANASDHFFKKTLDELVPEVEFTEKYLAIDPIYIPYNSIFVPKF